MTRLLVVPKDDDEEAGKKGLLLGKAVADDTSSVTDAKHTVNEREDKEKRKIFIMVNSKKDPTKTTRSFDNEIDFFTLRLTL